MHSIKHVLTVFLSFFLATNCHQKEKLTVPSRTVSPAIDILDYESCSNLKTALQNPSAVKYLTVDISSLYDYKALCSNLNSLQNLETIGVYSDLKVGGVELVNSLERIGSLREVTLKGKFHNIFINLKNLKQIKELYLINNGVRRIPIDFLNDIPLETLSIREEDDYFLFYGELMPNTHLKIFEIYGYECEKMSNQIYSLDSLNELVITKSKIKIISDKIKSIKKLKRVVLRSTPFAEDKTRVTRLKKWLGDDCVVVTDVDVPFPD